MAKKETAAAPVQAEAVYTKERLVGSKRYATRRDLVSVLLEDGRQYTLAEVDEKIEAFRKGKVK